MKSKHNKMYKCDFHVKKFADSKIRMAICEYAIRVILEKWWVGNQQNPEISRCKDDE